MRVGHSGEEMNGQMDKHRSIVLAEPDRQTSKRVCNGRETEKTSVMKNKNRKNQKMKKMMTSSTSLSFFLTDLLVRKSI